MSVIDPESVRIELSDEIAYVVMGPGSRSTAIDGDMIFELISAFGWIADRSGASAAVLTSANQDFCTGYDLSWLEAETASCHDELAAQTRLGIEHLNQVFVELRRIPVPVVAAIEGRAIGPGLSLALACDLRVAADDALLSFGFGDLGVPPHAGLTYFLPRIVAPARALELLLENRSFEASEAHSEGLVQHLASPGETLALATERAKHLTAERDPRAIENALHSSRGRASRFS